MKFEQYSFAQEIKNNLAKLGFRRPTDIQYKSIPSILKGEDVLAIAQTGTGKTAAFAIPVINMIYIQKKKKLRADGIRCIVMEPTRELALQVTEVFQTIGKGTGVKSMALVGGVEQDPQIEKLTQGMDILVATPGRVFDLVSQGHLNLRKIEVLILDEADHMLDKGFIKDIRDLIRFLPKKRQTLFFSATINDTIKKLSYSLVTNPVRIQLSPKNPVAKNVKHAVAFVEMDDKRFFLERVVTENKESKILVFVRTKVRAERVMKAMERAGIKSITIHGGKEQDDRLETMDSFKKGEVKVLIATDVTSRGIDIPNIDYVVNYDLPDVSENYVHRVGRTGRGNQKGKAVSFCSTDEKEMLEEIETYLGHKVDVMEINQQDRSQTLEVSHDASHDWKKLIKEAEEAPKKKRKKK